ncbi:guanine-1-methyltransferase-domain-containing protein [Lipomyces oligophaga]|uniref:guanine-1-methyltransferase-domain-containing protein n=1 Tax=Lipomyces oligophaga TaxID=45792 RepID=UPI0034CFE95C
MDRPARLETPEGMSRRAFKRQMREQRWAETRDERNQYRKEQRIQKRRQKQNRIEPASSEQHNLLEGIHSIRKRDVAANMVPIKIIIDCSFDDLMIPKERLSLAAQLTKCYAENRRATHPVDLHVTSLDKTLRYHFDELLQGQYKRWNGISFSYDPYPVPASEESMELSKLVYLSSDSENVLTKLEHGMTYIIGGIVDKGRHKNLCRNKASEQGIQTAKLPIAEFIKISGRQVLATNHVFEIMLKWIELEDWKLAFQYAIPLRKQDGFESSKMRLRKLKAIESAGQNVGDQDQASHSIDNKLSEDQDELDEHNTSIDEVDK